MPRIVFEKELPCGLAAALPIGHVGRTKGLGPPIFVLRVEEGQCIFLDDFQVINAKDLTFDYEDLGPLTIGKD